MEEFMLWKGKANLKTGIIKVPGDMEITNKKILFKTAAKEIEIRMEKIKNVAIEGKILKRIKIETPASQYSFFIPHAEDVLHLIKNFMHK